jgi:hypothetical protein
MIFGADEFGAEEFANTRWHDIRDWVLLCRELNTEWTPAYGLTGKPCEGDNITQPIDCIVVPLNRTPEEVTEIFNGLRSR